MLLSIFQSNVTTPFVPSLFDVLDVSTVERMRGTVGFPQNEKKWLVVHRLIQAPSFHEKKINS